MKDRWLPCEVTRKPCGKTSVPVVLQEVTEISAHHELVTWVGIPHGSWERGPRAILKPVLKELGGILVVGALVDTRGPIPVRLANLMDAPVIIPPGCLGRVVTRLSGPSAYDVRIRQHPKWDSGSRQSSVVKPRSWRGPCWRRQVPNFHARASFQELYHETCRHVNSPSMRQRLAGLLVRRRAFAHNHTDLGSFNKIKHEINTNGAAPVREQVRHIPRGFEGEEKCLQEQLQACVIWPSSDWAAPTVLVRKFDGTVGWCIDYRSLNDCFKDAYPLPRIDMCFDSLDGVRYFSILDLDHLVGEGTEEAEDPAPSPDKAFCGKRWDMQFAPSSGFPKPRSPPPVRLSSPVIPPPAFKSISLTAVPSSSAKPTTTVTALAPLAQPSSSQASSVTKPAETARPKAPERDSKSRTKPRLHADSSSEPLTCWPGPGLCPHGRGRRLHYHPGTHNCP